MKHFALLVSILIASESIGQIGQYPIKEWTTNGPFILKRRGTNLCVTLLNGAEQAFARYHLADCRNLPEQHWTFQYGSEGSYTIESALSKKCIDLYGGSSDEGVIISQYVCTGADNQLWQFELTEEDTYKIRSKPTQKCFDIALGLTAHQTLCTQDNFNQVFVVTEVKK